MLLFLLWHMCSHSGPASYKCVVTRTFARSGASTHSRWPNKSFAATAQKSREKKARKAGNHQHIRVLLRKYHQNVRARQTCGFECWSQRQTRVQKCPHCLQSSFERVWNFHEEVPNFMLHRKRDFWVKTPSLAIRSFLGGVLIVPNRRYLRLG